MPLARVYVWVKHSRAKAATDGAPASRVDVAPTLGAPTNYRLVGRAVLPGLHGTSEDTATATISFGVQDFALATTAVGEAAADVTLFGLCCQRAIAAAAAAT